MSMSPLEMDIILRGFGLGECQATIEINLTMEDLENDNGLSSSSTPDVTMEGDGK